jgi:hypothetical protein
LSWRLCLDLLRRFRCRACFEVSARSTDLRQGQFSRCAIFVRSSESLARFVVPAQAPVSAPKDLRFPLARPSCLAFFPLLRLFPLGFFTRDLLRLRSVVAASFRVPWLVEQLPKIFSSVSN